MSSTTHGPRRDELIVSVARSNLPADVDPEVGQRLQMSSPDGQTFQATATNTSEEAIILDANHPLVGQDLTFEIQLVGTA